MQSSKRQIPRLTLCLKTLTPVVITLTALISQKILLSVGTAPSVPTQKTRLVATQELGRKRSYFIITTTPYQPYGKILVFSMHLLDTVSHPRRPQHLAQPFLLPWPRPVPQSMKDWLRPLLHHVRNLCRRSNPLHPRIQHRTRLFTN